VEEGVVVILIPSDAKTLAHTRSASARLRRVRQSLCRILQAQKAPTRSHWRETLPVHL